MIVQILLTAIFYLWLFAVLGLLWRQAINFHIRMRVLQTALIECTMKSADAASKAAEAAHLLASALENKPHATD